jgi:hypothetical protein
MNAFGKLFRCGSLLVVLFSCLASVAANAQEDEPPPIADCMGIVCNGGVTIPGDDGEVRPPGESSIPVRVRTPADGSRFSLTCARIDYANLPAGAAGVALLNCPGVPPLSSVGMMYQAGQPQAYSQPICMPAGFCQPAQASPDVPCAPLVADGVISFDCLIDGRRIAVSSECPVNAVQRTPYPRALVGLPTYLALQPDRFGTGGQSGAVQVLSQDVGANGQPASLGAYQLGIAIRSQRLPAGVHWLGESARGPEWSFADGAEGSGAAGDLARYSWRYSSHGQPPNGVGVDRATQLPLTSARLPAWEVVVTTSCGHEVSWVYRVAEEATTTGACQFFVAQPTPQSPSCGPVAADGSGWYRETQKKLQWRRVLGQDAFPADWRTIDLRNHGGQHAYAVMRRVRELGVIDDGLFDPNIIGQSLWVPVIEVQSVLRSEQCYQNPAACPVAP